MTRLADEIDSRFGSIDDPAVVAAVVAECRPTVIVHLAAGPGAPGVASARAGNVIGGGDWADHRLIPDVIRSFGTGTEVVIRQPEAARPWQHVLEPLSGYLVLAQELASTDPDQRAAAAEGWNFGPADRDARPVQLDRRSHGRAMGAGGVVADRAGCGP